jgi:hypothetical protein
VTRRRVLKVSKVKRWRNEKKRRLMKARGPARRCEPEMLILLAPLMVRASRQN